MRFGEVTAFVSLVIPCLNEEAAIGAIVGDCLAMGVDEVIVVDGGSTDATAKEAAAAGARIVVETRRGYGRACAAGVSAVAPETEIIAFMDGDGSDSPEFLPAIIGPIAGAQADFVMGSRVRGRRQEGALTRQQIAAGRVAGLMMRALHGVRFTDMSPYAQSGEKTSLASVCVRRPMGGISKCRCAPSPQSCARSKFPSTPAAASAACRKCRAIWLRGSQRPGSSRPPSCGSSSSFGAKRGSALDNRLSRRAARQKDVAFRFRRRFRTCGARRPSSQQHCD